MIVPVGLSDFCCCRNASLFSFQYRMAEKWFMFIATRHPLTVCPYAQKLYIVTRYFTQIGTPMMIILFHQLFVIDMVCTMCANQQS